MNKAHKKRSKSFSMSKSLWIALAVSGIFAVLGLIAKPSAAASPSATIGMPFSGKWAYNALVNPSSTPPPYNDTTSSHPSVHHTPGTLGGDWATDLYAAEGTAVKLKVPNATGDVTFSWGTSTTSCGQSTRVNVFVDNVQVGWVYYAHINNAVTSGPITEGMQLGTVKDWGSCNAGKHVHVQFKNVSNFSCYTDHGKPGESVLSEGTSLGVLGSGNTGSKQACSQSSGGGGGIAVDKIDELGFIRSNHSSGKAELVSYHGAPNYGTLKAYALTGYPATSDPNNVKPIAIDTNGDGIDELGLVRFNHSSGKTELSLWHGAPHYTTHLVTTFPGYPAISDPQNVKPVAIDVTGDGIDELGFVRTYHSSGRSVITVYNGAPNYLTLWADTTIAYPSISDPWNVTPIALDLNGDKYDELAFIRTNHSSGRTEIVAYHGAPNYGTLYAPPALTGYPAISDPQNVKPIAIDVTGDGIDELAFIRFNHSSGKTEASIWNGAPSFTTPVPNTLTGYPAIIDPQNVTPLAIDLP